MPHIPHSSTASSFAIARHRSIGVTGSCARRSIPRNGSWTGSERRIGPVHHISSSHPLVARVSIGQAINAGRTGRLSRRGDSHSPVGLGMGSKKLPDLASRRLDGYVRQRRGTDVGVHATNSGNYKPEAPASEYLCHVWNSCTRWRVGLVEKTESISRLSLISF
jgi:hypothetical protein